MEFSSLFACLCIFIVGTVLCNNRIGFDDSVLFKINWPGELPSEYLKVEDEVMHVTSPSNEKYDCRIPGLLPRNPVTPGSYTGPSPLQLLNPLFSQKVCSYRIESYWSYELCHGRFVRQYHEEREGKKVKIQEYFLGRWTREKQLDLESQLSRSNNGNEEKLKYKKIDGINLPYVELEMSDGTICDLNGKPRVTRVLYVCFANGKHEVYSFKETWTCEYEVIILSPFLCSHPKYKSEDSGENSINCLPSETSPKKPRSLLAIEAESLKLRHQKILDNKAAKDVLAVFKVEQVGEDGDHRVKVEIHPLDLQANKIKANSDVHKLTPGPPPPIEDTSPVRAFLEGEKCLNGGAGWWKYEFCYGKSVEQYHIDRSGTRQSLLLGKFYKHDHLVWISQNPHKKPKPKGQLRTQISHLYTRGSLCDKTDKPRQTEVKLKCPENSSSAGQVSLYLLEPKTCQYILVVESPLICDILHLADDDGMIKSQEKPADEGEAAPEDQEKAEKESKSDKEVATLEIDLRLAND